MTTAYDNLTTVVEPEKITKITLNELELDVDRTLELMKETEIEDLFSGLVFWTKTSKINRTTGYDDLYDCEKEYFQEIQLRPKTKKKVVPDSLVEMWRDPETREELPYKTKAYLKREEEIRLEKEKREIKYRQEQFQAIKDKINKYTDITEKANIEPLTIMKGGIHDVCRYVVLPKNFPIPRSSFLFIKNEDFYKDMDQEVMSCIDFAGMAGVYKGKLQPLFKYGESCLDMFTEEEQQEIRDLINNAINEGKLATIVGISEVSSNFSHLGVDPAADKVVEEFKKYI